MHSDNALRGPTRGIRASTRLAVVEGLDIIRVCLGVYRDAGQSRHSFSLFILLSFLHYTWAPSFPPKPRLRTLRDVIAPLKTSASAKQYRVNQKQHKMGMPLRSLTASRAPERALQREPQRAPEGERPSLAELSSYHGRVLS